MSGSSGQSKFADYRAIDHGTAIILSISVVMLANNEARKLEQMFCPIPERINEGVQVGVDSVDGTVVIAPNVTSAVDIIHQQPKFILREDFTSRTVKRVAGGDASAAELQRLKGRGLDVRPWASPAKGEFRPLRLVPARPRGQHWPTMDSSPRSDVGNYPLSPPHPGLSNFVAEVQDPPTFTLPVPLEVLWPTARALMILKEIRSLGPVAAR